MRPTKFKPEYCEELIEHMKEGLSFEAFAGKLEVSKQTLYNWCETNIEFQEAKEIATEQSRLFWEQQGKDGLYKITETTEDEDGNEVTTTKIMNPTIWIFNMKNRFGWRDKQPGEEDKTIHFDDISKKSDSEIESRIQTLLKLREGI